MSRFSVGLAALVSLALLTPLVTRAGTPAAAAPSAAPAAAPSVGVGSVLRPIFTLADGKSFEAGTAFAAEFNGETLILTAFHLFGPVGGLPTQVEPDAMATAVKKARFVDGWANQKVGTDVSPVRVPGAHPMGADANGDLAVFRIPAGFDRISAGTTPPFAGLPLAEADPKLGDRVWLAAPVVDSTVRLHPAKVVEVKPTFLFYEFDTVIELRATSGGPVLDAQGRVVGIHLGGGLDAGKTIGAAGPISGVRARLAEALKP